MRSWDILEDDFEKIQFEDHFTVLVLYDIVSDKRRTKLVKLLNGFGYRIQKSVFECLLTREKCEKLFRKIDEFAQPEDLIRAYRLNQNVQVAIYGEVREEENEICRFV